MRKNQPLCQSPWLLCSEQHQIWHFNHQPGHTAVLLGCFLEVFAGLLSDEAAGA
jgi:hypothetical protein